MHFTVQYAGGVSARTSRSSQLRPPSLFCASKTSPGPAGAALVGATAGHRHSDPPSLQSARRNRAAFMPDCDAICSATSHAAASKPAATSDSIPRENLVPLPQSKARKNFNRHETGHIREGPAALKTHRPDSFPKSSCSRQSCPAEEIGKKLHIFLTEREVRQNCQAEDNGKKLHSFLTEHEDLVRKKLLESMEAILQHVQSLVTGSYSAPTLQPLALDANLDVRSIHLHEGIHVKQSSSNSTGDEVFTQFQAGISNGSTSKSKGSGEWSIVAAEEKLQQIHVLNPVYDDLATKTSSNLSRISSGLPSMLPQPPSATCNNRKSGVSFQLPASDVAPCESGLSSRVNGSILGHHLSTSGTMSGGDRSWLWAEKSTNQARRRDMLAQLPSDYVEHLQTCFERLAEMPDKMSLEACSRLIESFSDEQVEEQTLLDVLQGERQDIDDADAKDVWVTFEDFCYLMSCGRFDSCTEEEEGPECASEKLGKKKIQRSGSGTTAQAFKSFGTAAFEAVEALEARQASLSTEADKRRVRYPMVVLFCECAPAVVIMLNALCIGMRADMAPEAHHWKVLDVGFLAFYMAEAAVKLWVFGCPIYWCGPEWHWNWFDVLCIFISFGDMAVAYLLPLFKADVNVDKFGEVGVMKMLRLAKLGRLVKALRYPVFNELKAMIFGVVSGVRVILWAIVLLFACVFFLGTVMNLMVGLKFHEFSSVPASMFTVFRCFTDGCTSYDGVPLQELLRQEYGAIFILAYTFSFMFITVGVFNLIMATFIDNVLRNTEMRKQEELGQQSERIRAGLQSNAVRLIITMNKTKRHRAISDHLQKQIEKAWHKDPVSAFEMLPGNLTISKPFFEMWLQDKEFRTILTDADIDMSCTTNFSDLFDVLDADMSGELTLEELIDGLMRLRGPITKRDMVGVRMQVRFITHMIAAGSELLPIGQRLTDAPEKKLSECSSLRSESSRTNRSKASCTKKSTWSVL